MTPIEKLFQSLVNFQLDLWLIAKTFILFALAIYIVFGIIVIKEVDLMNRTLKGVFNLPIKLVAWIHLIFTLVIFVIALIYL